MTEYTLTIPENYQRVPLPFFNEWITALRSGEYKQGMTYLFKSGEYCCLGILSKIQGRLVEVPPKAEIEGSFSRGSDTTDGDFHLLTPGNPCHAVLNVDGSFPNNIMIRLPERGRDLHASLTGLNDAGFPFTDIADIIEKIWCPIPTQ